MVIRKKGSVFFIDGKEFKIGGGVFANDESEYMGLYGTVTEIRTDEDRETENDTPDIYCEFMSPDSVAMAAELETRFSDLYRQDMQLEEISLDCVIMSPEMLEPVPAREPESIGNQLTLTCLEDQIDHVDGVTLAISNDKVNNIRGMALESQEEFDAALGDGSKADTVRKAFIKLRGELTHLYQMQCSLRTAAQSDSETALVDDLLADLEKISRKAHEQTHFTYTTLEEIAALN